MSLTVYGSSDDLVEIEGDIREEFDISDSDTTSYLAVSDGTVLRIVYSGLWHITRISKGTAAYEHQAATEEEDGYRADGSPCYSDHVTLTTADGQPMAWIVFGRRFEGAK